MYPHSNEQIARYTDAMEQGSAMFDFPDEASGIPVTPPIDIADEPILLREVDDIDEFGIAADPTLMSHVARLGARVNNTCFD